MFAPGPDALNAMRCLWVTNEGARQITHNSIRTLLEVAPDLADSLHIGYLGDSCGDYFRETFPHASVIDVAGLPGWDEFVLDGTDENYADFGSVEFRDVSFARYFVLMFLMQREDVPVLYIDGDIGFVSDPRPQLLRATVAGASVLIQSDLPFHRRTRHDDDGRARLRRRQQRTLCTGFMCWSGAARTQAMAQRVIDGRRVDQRNGHDQRVLNELPLEELHDFVSLPEQVFLNGSYVFKNGRRRPAPRRADGPVPQACLVHANWMIGMRLKIDALKLVGLWRL
ncbi:MAG: putative nucleotide-diphospho-sugar transferase [Ilumatobacter sp.]